MALEGSDNSTPEDRDRAASPAHASVNQRRRWRRRLQYAIVATLAACAQHGGPSSPAEKQENVALVKVYPKVVSIGIGESARFLAYGLITPEDSILADVSWAATGGTITPDGVFTAGADTGAFEVTATHVQKLYLSDSATVDVALVPSSVERVAIRPENPSVALGDSLDFFAVGLTGAGDTLLVSATWAATSGTITPVALGQARYKPAQTGTFSVVATVGTLGDTTMVTVAPTSVASVDVTPAGATVGVGQTLQLAATPRDASGTPLTGRTVTWTTSASGIATVTQDGLVTGQNTGTATITATSDGQSGTSNVTVSSVPVASVTVTPASANLTVLQTVQLTATVRDAGANVLTGRGVTWTTDAPAVATVTASGRVTGRGVGTATITATSEGQSGTASVTVALAPVASVTVTPSAPTISVGQNIQLIATLKDGLGNVLTGRVVTWSTSAPSVATVNGTGVVTPVAVGTAKVAATSEGKSDTATVTVTLDAVASVSVTPSTVSLAVGGTAQLTATPLNASGNALTGRTITWSTTNPSVATVNSNGLVSGKAAGSVTISATSEGKSGSAVASVTAIPVATVTVTPASLNLDAGESGQFTATLRDSAGNVLTGRSVTWATSASAVATVNGSGLATGQGAGTATISATSEGKSGTATATVTVVPVASVSVSPSTLSLNVGQSSQLTATPRDANGNALSGRIVTWATSATAVATVSTGGLVSGQGTGTATITATSEGKSGSAAATVTQATGCSSSLSNVGLPLCDGTYSQSITPSSFPAGSVIEAQHPGKVRFTGGFITGTDLTFRGIVVIGSGQKELGNRSVFEDMSFVGGPSCGNTVNTATGSNVTIRRSAFYGKGGRYQVLAYQQSGVTLEDVIIRSDGGWGQGGSGCSEYEPNAALNFYNSSNVTCSGCILFDGITEATSSELLGGLGVNCHNTSSGMLFEGNVTVNSVGAYWAGGNGACNNVIVRNSIANGNNFSGGGLWAYVRNVTGTTQLINFTSDGTCATYKGSTTLTDSKVASVNGCAGSTNGVGASVTLNTTFLNDPRWRQEMCTDAGVTRGWCGTTMTLSEYLRSF